MNDHLKYGYAKNIYNKHNNECKSFKEIKQEKKLSNSSSFCNTSSSEIVKKKIEKKSV